MTAGAGPVGEAAPGPPHADTNHAATSRARFLIPVASYEPDPLALTFRVASTSS